MLAPTANRDGGPLHLKERLNFLKGAVVKVYTMVDLHSWSCGMPQNCSDTMDIVPGTSSYFPASLPQPSAAYSQQAMQSRSLLSPSWLKQRPHRKPLKPKQQARLAGILRLPLQIKESSSCWMR